jgi:hypothetical protein
MPEARKVVKDVAAEHGACIRPLQLRRTDLTTGEVDQVLVPCGHTLASVCPSCAERAKALRAAQCREGWHLEDEPVIEPDPPIEMQRFWITKRAEAQVMHDRAARDALHFAALFDRFMQNLRRFCGYDVQYFAAVEPQRRLAPHIHLAIRGTISRAELRQVIAATYYQVWWPSTEDIKFDGDHQPIWDEHAATYLDPDTGEVLPTWDEALDTIRDQDEPLHVVRFGDRFDAQGVLAGSKDASRCIGYLTKYLTKHVGDCHQATTAEQAAHADRLADALRYEPCSPTCANWLRYGIQPKNAHPGVRPGCCKGKAHRREYLGYAGRRVLVSRKWSGKTLADHRADRKAWLTEMLDLPATDPDRYTWEPVTPGDADHMPNPQRLLHVVADRMRWLAALDQARRRAAGGTGPDLSATGRAA